MELSLIEALGVATVNKNLTFSDFKYLADWLGVYQYILPTNRTLHYPLCSLLHNCTLSIPGNCTPTKLFELWLLSDTLYTCFTLEQQTKLYEYLLSKEYR